MGDAYDLVTIVLSLVTVGLYVTLLVHRLRSPEHHVHPRVAAMLLLVASVSLLVGALGHGAMHLNDDDLIDRLLRISALATRVVLLWGAVYLLARR